MKKLLLLALFAGSVVWGATPASACHKISPWKPGCWIHNAETLTVRGGGGIAYKGGCGMSVVSDTTDVLGGQDVYNGDVDAEFVADTPTDHITGWCELIVNSVSQGDVLDATFPGIAFAAAAGRTTFTAPDGSVVQLCDHVTTTSGGTETNCGAAINIPVCPDQFCGDGGLFDEAFAVLQPVFDAIDQLKRIPNSTLCPILISAAPTVDSLPTAGVLYINPVEGDLYVGGTTEESLFWDCPPYQSLG